MHLCLRENLVEKIDEEAYPEEYHGPKESSDADDRVYPKKGNA